MTTEIEHELLKQYDRGVCCFSAIVDNPLLWSHYSDQHRGLCIGYGFNRDPKPELHKVHYGGDRLLLTSLIAKALLNNNPKSQELLDRNVLLQKAPPWRYEREWRLFGNRGIQDSPLELKDITFGLRCPPSVMYSIVMALEHREDEVKFYKMHDIQGSFKLEQRSVDIDEMRAHLPHTARSGIEIFGPIDEE